MTETHLRSVVKAISWRTVASITTLFLVYLFTGSIELTVSIAFMEIVYKLVVYYIHERVWNMSKWGISKK